VYSTDLKRVVAVEREGLVQMYSTNLKRVVAVEREGLVQVYSTDLKRVVAVEREGLVQMYSSPRVANAGTFSTHIIYLIFGISMRQM